MKPTQEQILSALNKLVRENKTELKAEKIELGMVDDLKKEVQKAKSKVDAAERLHKAAEKDNDKLNKMNKEWLALKGKAKSQVKVVKDTVDFGKENVKEAKSTLSKSNKNVAKIVKQLKELGLDTKIINSELNEIDKLNSTLKSLNFDFMDDLPF